MAIDINKSTLLNQLINNKPLTDAINDAKLLLVGCGGIGCEVIKDLLLIGFRDIAMIDLDTIDVSNLNRQFLFNKTHINQSKAKITAEVAERLFTHSSYIQKLNPIHNSIQSQEYNVDFFKTFTFVINALDNRQARSHVNRMCLAADVPLIESGTEGYIGQTFMIKKNVSACYECDGPKQDQKVYASCTIRNTPSLPIHCIVWAKHLFAQLFGEEDPDNDVSPDMNDPELNGNKNNVNAVHSNGNNKENDAIDSNGDVSEEKNGNVNCSGPPSTKKWAHNNNYDPALLFDKLFRIDIEYLHKMDKLWKNRTRPVTLTESKLSEMDQELSDQSSSSGSCEVNATNNGTSSNPVLKDQRMWSLSECYTIFADSINVLKSRLDSEDYLVWDKDDEVALNFVTSVSNLRAQCFHIERSSKFDVKSMAGNIIPAISSTNSIIGGLMVLQVINLMRKISKVKQDGEPDKVKIDAACKDVSKHIYLRRVATNASNLVASYEIFPPNPKCLVCCTQHIPEVEVALNLKAVTLHDFVEHVLYKKLNFVCPDVQLDGEPVLIWSKDDEEEFTDEEKEIYTTKIMANYSMLRDRTRLKVYDLLQDLTVIITLVQQEINASDNHGLFYTLKVVHEAEKPVAEPEAEPMDVLEVKDSEKRKIISLDDDDIEEEVSTKRVKVH